MTHNFRPGLMTIRDAEKLNELQRWIDNRRAALAIPANRFPPSYKFQAKITAYSSDDYSWTRQSFDPDGEYIDDPVAYAGTPSYMPAKERNGKIAVDFPFYAELTFRVNVQGAPYYEFDYTVVDRITIKEVDGSPSVLAKTLELPNSAMSNPSAGVARLLEASTTTGGTLTTNDQDLSGTKNIVGNDGPASSDAVMASRTQYIEMLGTPLSQPTIAADTLVPVISTVTKAWTGTYGAPNAGNLFLHFDGNAAAPRLVLKSSSGADPCFSIYQTGSASIANGASGTLAPSAVFVGGVCVNIGSGSFFSGAAGDLTGTLDGGSF